MPQSFAAFRFAGLFFFGARAVFGAPPFTVFVFVFAVGFFFAAIVNTSGEQFYTMIHAHRTEAAS